MGIKPGLAPGCLGMMRHPRAKPLELPTDAFRPVKLHGESHSFNIYELGNALSKEACKTGDNVAAKGMADHVAGRQGVDVENALQIIDQVRWVKIAVADPIAVAVPAKIWRNHAIIARKHASDSVPAPQSIAPRAGEREVVRSAAPIQPRLSAGAPKGVGTYDPVPLRYRARRARRSNDDMSNHLGPFVAPTTPFGSHKPGSSPSAPSP
jgi:hypothetical protein